MASAKNSDKTLIRKTKGGKATVEKSKFSPSQIKQFGSEVKKEFNKIAWPNRKHTLGSTVVVTIFVTVIAVYLGTVDLLLGWMIGLVFK